MTDKTKTTYRINIFLIILLSLSIFLTGCSQTSAPDINIDATMAFEHALQTATFAIQITNTPEPPKETATLTPTVPTPTETVDPNRTPPALPAEFQTSLLNPKDLPHSYIEDTCQYLKMRWDPNNSSPGTIVMPIMFHSITDGEATKQFQISHADLEELVRDLVDQGFNAITMDQLSDFLYNNAKIPKRSFIFIVDDRHHDDYYDTHFKPFYDAYGWTVVNGWISDPGTLMDVVLQENVRVENEGWVDHQAHGVVHNIPIEKNSSEQYMQSELFGSMSYVEEYFGKAPIAYIWPGGGFTPRAAEIAREAGYKLGFTVNPRGPIMFNWVPLANENDEARPSFQMEGDVGDPLMVLPRFWDQDARYYLDTVRSIGKEADKYAGQNKAIELEYYDIVCKGITGEIPKSAE